MKVLDLSCDVAGRFATKLFAQDGAEVFRCAPDDGPGPLSQYLDTEKQLVEPARLQSLLEQCELVWTSFDRGKHLGSAAQLKVPESLVHVTTSSFGMTGPYAARRGGPMADWAAGGYLYITGDPDREPLSGPEHLCAYAAGYTAAAGTEAALIDKRRTGRGRHLDISTMEAMLLLHQSTFSRTHAGQLRRRTGRYTEVYPLTVLPCRDGHVSIGVVSDAEFDKLAVAIGMPELTADPRFADREARSNSRDALDRELARYLELHDGEEIVGTLQAGGVACAKVDGPLAVTRNPQLKHRDYWQRAPLGGVMPGHPLGHFHPFENLANAPSLGEPGTLPLAGVRVLDFTIFWAGPSATRTLADLGADVIWVERPGARLDCHIEDGATPTPTELMFHLHDTKMFRGKRSIALDLLNPEDRTIAHDLARQSHIVVENFRPGVADRLGIGPSELSKINPGLIYVSLSGWGSNGPWADWRSYGPSIEAASSIEGRTGYVDREPLRLGHTLPDATGGLVGALAALRGLRKLIDKGQGGWFDISQLEAYVAMSGEEILSASREGKEPPLAGNFANGEILQGVLPCKGEDRWIAIRLSDKADRLTFTRATGVEVLPGDNLQEILSPFTREQDASVLAEHLQRDGLEAFAVLNAHDLTGDPHLRERQFFVDVPAAKQIFPMPGSPFVSKPPMADPQGQAPRPGEHGSARF